MPRGRASNMPADRATDPRPATPELAKPAVLSRATQRWLCLACLAMIVYGTLGPLGPGHGSWLRQPETWRWMPERLPTDANDVFTNLMVYIPVGIALRLLVRRRGRAGWIDLLLGLTLATMLSYVTELLQQFMPMRSSNLVDIYVNAAGAFLGCLAAVRLQWLLRRLHALIFAHIHLRRGLWSLTTCTALAATFVVMTMPWDLTRPVRFLGDASALASVPFDLKRPGAWLGLGQPMAAADPLALGRFTVFVGLGFLLAGRQLYRGCTRRQAVRGAVVRAALFTFALEIAQAALSAHVSSLLHALIASTAAIVGAVLAVRVLEVTPAEQVAEPDPNPLTTETAPAPEKTDTAEPTEQPARPAPAPRTPPQLSRALQRLGTVALLGVMLTMVGKSVLNGLALPSLRAEPLLEWIPFQGHFAASFSRVIADLVQQLTIFGAITATCLLLTQGRGRLAALLLLLGLTGLIEVCQAFVEGHGADTTSFVIATVAWFVTTRVWASIYPTGQPPIPATPSGKPLP